MKYEITGTFINGEVWGESANNLNECKFVLDKIYGNSSINSGSVKIKRYGIDVTTEIIKRFYGDE